MWRKAIGTVTAGSLLVVAASVFWSSEAGGAGQGYRFSNVSSRMITTPAPGTGAPDRVVEVRFSSSWDVGQSPGLRMCTLRVLSTDGAVMAERTVEFFDQTPSLSEQTLIIRPHEMDRLNRHGNIEFDCEPSRLDDPAATYEFTNIEIYPDPEFDGDESLRLTFDSRWKGTGRPSVQECVATVNDAAGQRLFEYPFTFSDGLGQSDDFSFALLPPSGTEAHASDAAIACRPVD